MKILLFTHPLLILNQYDFISSPRTPNSLRTWVKYSIKQFSHSIVLKNRFCGTYSNRTRYNFECAVCFERSEMKRRIRWKAISYAPKMKASQILWWLRVWCIVLFLIRLTRTEGVLLNAVMGLIKCWESLRLVKEISFSKNYKFPLKPVCLVQKAFKPKDTYCTVSFPKT